MPTVYRAIGPIPNQNLDPTDDSPFAHAGGPAPKWGGYCPVEVPTNLHNFLAPEVLAMVPEREWFVRSIYRAHVAETLMFRNGADWYVLAPADRFCRRAAVIAAGALADGAPVPRGVREDEAEFARVHGARTWKAPLPS